MVKRTALRLCISIPIGFFLFGGMVVGSWSVRAEPLKLQVHHENVGQSRHLQLVFTHDTWYGKPIYRLMNQSPTTLAHVSLESWSDESLPILYIGQQQPASWPSNADVLKHPPYRLAPEESLWFVGPRNPPVKLELHWLEGKAPKYEVVEAGKATKIH